MHHAVKISFYFLAVAVASLAGVSRAQAFELKLLLLDAQENAVVGAVIELNDATEAATPTATPAMPVAIMDQVERRFVPMVLLIEVGQAVDFPNSDNVRHHVYSFSAIKQFSPPLYADESIEPIVFDKPGIAVLGCNIHDSMAAYVYVSQAAHRGISDEGGHLRLADLPSNPGTVSVWHPWLQTPDNRLAIDVSAFADGAQVRVELPVQSPDNRFGFRALSPKPSK